MSKNKDVYVPQQYTIPVLRVSGNKIANHKACLLLSLPGGGEPLHWLYSQCPIAFFHCTCCIFWWPQCEDRHHRHNLRIQLSSERYLNTEILQYSYFNGTSWIIAGSSENLDVNFRNLSKPPRWMIMDLFASLAASLKEKMVFGLLKVECSRFTSRKGCSVVPYYHTLDNKEQQDLATTLFFCSPASSMHWRSTSIPPFSDMERHISSCGNTQQNMVKLSYAIS